ncbi:MAG: fumarate hydratase [Pyrinomonadaceae bacterium]|nr:fumarate hydratase [Sphingobacteriaceae bacterium]
MATLLSRGYPIKHGIILRVSCLLFIISCFFSSCKFNPNYQGRGADFLQGLWEEEKFDFQDSLLQFTHHKFRFTCDSVYVTLNTITKANYYPDSCFNNGKWTEYAKGTYVISNDTLYIIGTFTKSNFKQKLSGCYRIGQYLPTFVIKKTQADKLELQGLQQHIPLNLRLKEKIKCIPQPL